MTPATQRLCRYCGDPLPPQKGRSRPRVAHEGECARKYHNRRRLNWRIDRFRAAHRADRSDECAWAASQYNADDYDPDGFSTSRGAYDDVHGDALIEAMNAWELAETIRKALARAEYQAREAERKLQQIERERRYKEARAAVSPEEWEARIARRVEHWRERLRR
ncbi:hypothetical protein [[Micrococcus luteus] ATCC 49442]|uniref:hypothetical protein n=1 Tax=[Micrococcus luteus] ATCC 49442 TaxID=2698727 RepID=UPI0013DD4960|nr:hypothetical protein [[Micrococcus luteus] ATCC 49442]